MTASTLAGPLAFVLLSGLMCWHIATVRGKWSVKLAFIALVPSFGLLLWSGTASFLGWPTEEPLPEKSLLTGIDIKEPTINGTDNGAIYVMVVSLDEETNLPILGYRQTMGEPRLHVLPYTRKLHEMFEAARRRMAEGHPVVLERAKKNGHTNRHGEESVGVGFHRRESDFLVYDLPPFALPKKDYR